MRFALCLVAALLCMLMATGVMAEETVLPPDYPVPRYVEWLLEVARAELGYVEASNGYTKYGDWAGDPTAEWCAEFLCWCVNQVDEQYGTQLLRQVYPMYSGTNTGLRWYLKAGRYVSRTGHVNDWGSQWYIGQEGTLPSGSYVPQPGDWVFYSVDGQNTSHVALVEYCSMNEKGVITAHVIEGNMPDRVQRNTHVLTDWRVLGYGTVYDLVDTVLRSGCESVKVTRLQEKLNYLGYLDAQYITGTYGPSTVQAVEAFQQATGKVPTGIANHHTQLTLDQMYEEAYWLDDRNFQVVEE